MSTTKNAPAEPQGWVDYLLMFVFIVVLNKKYPARSQEPDGYTTWLIVYMIKTPLQALSVYLLGEYVFHKYLLHTFKLYLILGVVFAFWEFIFHRVLHINKHVLALLKRRHTRRLTMAFMKANPDLGATLVWVNVVIVIGYLSFFLVYLGLVIISPVNAKGY